MAYRPDDPYNTGIGTPDLGLGNINQGQVPIQVAEKINYGVLPQAKEPFEPDWTMVEKYSPGVKSYKGTTKGDYVDALMKGEFGVTGKTSFERFKDDLFEGVAGGEIGTGWTDDALPTFVTPKEGSFSGYIDVPKKDVEGAGELKSLPEGFWADDDQAYLDPDFYNEYGYPLTAIDPISAAKGLMAVGTKLIPKELMHLYKIESGINAPKKLKKFITKKKKKEISNKEIAKNLAKATAAQKATIAANREAAKKFGDKPQPIYHQETKSQDRGGRDIGSRVSDSYEKQQSAQYGMLAKGGLVNFFKNGGFLG